jgi:hypothetical protein
MKKNNKMKIKGIKKAVSKFNGWNGAATVYYDTDDNSVWTNVYTSCNSWTQYDSDTIHAIVSKGNPMSTQDDKISMQSLTEIIVSGNY